MQGTKTARGRGEPFLAQGRPLEAGASRRRAPAPRAPTSDLRARGSPRGSLPCSALSPDVSPASSRSGRTQGGPWRLCASSVDAVGRREGAGPRSPSPADANPRRTRLFRPRLLLSPRRVTRARAGCTHSTRGPPHTHSGRHTALSVSGSILSLTSPHRAHHQDGWCSTRAGNRTVSPRS